MISLTDGKALPYISKISFMNTITNTSKNVLNTLFIKSIKVIAFVSPNDMTENLK